MKRLASIVPDSLGARRERSERRAGRCRIVASRSTMTAVCVGELRAQCVATG